MIRKVFFAVFLLCSSFSIQAQVIAQFRGPGRNGVYPEKNLLPQWPEAGPILLWSTNEIGNGFGPPAVTSGGVYVTGEIDSLGYLFVFDFQGKLLWKAAYGKEWVKTYPGSRSTPTIAGNLVYVCSGLGNLSCFDLASGERKWTADMQYGLHGRFTMHGHAESPLVDGDQVFLTPGGADTNVVALNRFTGKINWICKGEGERPGYNSPILISLPTVKILVTFTAYHMLGIDAKTGKLLWVHEQINTPLAERKPGNGDTHSNSAYYENGYIYYVAGDGNGGVKLKLSDDGSQITQLWKNPDLDNYMGGFIKSGNNIYVGSDSKRSLFTVNITTGIVTDSLKIGNGSLCFADNRLYYYNQRGELKLLDPGIEKPVVLSSFKIAAGTKEHFSHPVIRDGVLYIRHGKALMAYDIRQKKN